MSELFGVLLTVWGASLVVLAIALTSVVVVQGVTRSTLAAAARLRSTRRLRSSLSGDRTQAV